jgi:hypothetical protein
VLLSTLLTPRTGRDGIPCAIAGAEVTAVAFSAGGAPSRAGHGSRRAIIATGWDRMVSLYEDRGQRHAPMLRAHSGPDSDVLSAAIMEGPQLALAAGCYGGQVCARVCGNASAPFCLRNSCFFFKTLQAINVYTLMCDIYKSQGQLYIQMWTMSTSGSNLVTWATTHCEPKLSHELETLV